MKTSRKSSKRWAVLMAAALALALVAPCAFSQEAPPEEEAWYGDRGTFELGLNGSITLPTKYIDPPTGFPDDDGTTTIMLAPFAKYFFYDHIHAGAMLIYMSMADDNNDTETTIIFFYPSAGYTLAIAPRFQLDASVNLGYCSLTFDDGTNKLEASQFSYGFTVMALSPLTESAVLGIGVIVAWYEPEFEGVETFTYRSTQIPIQVSFYF